MLFAVGLARSALQCHGLHRLLVTTACNLAVRSSVLKSGSLGYASLSLSFNLPDVHNGCTCPRGFFVEMQLESDR